MTHGQINIERIKWIQGYTVCEGQWWKFKDRMRSAVLREMKGVISFVHLALMSTLACVMLKA